MQIVSQLELQLQKERERLQAMMAHLHLTKEADLKNGPHPSVVGQQQGGILHGQRTGKGTPEPMQHRQSPNTSPLPHNDRPKVSWPKSGA